MQAAHLVSSDRLCLHIQQPEHEANNCLCVSTYMQAPIPPRLDRLCLDIQQPETNKVPCALKYMQVAPSRLTSMVRAFTSSSPRQTKSPCALECIHAAHLVSSDRLCVHIQQPEANKVPLRLGMYASSPILFHPIACAFTSSSPRQTTAYAP